MKKLYFFALIIVCLFSFSSVSIALQADDFGSYVTYVSVQHRTYWDAMNKLDRKIWRLAIGIRPDINPGNVSDTGGLDELISAIEAITFSFESAADTCADWSSPYTVAGPNTYYFNQVVQMAKMNYLVGVCPEYDRDLGQWNNTPLGSICYQEYELTFDIPKQDFSIINAECGRWLGLVTFNDGSSIEGFDFWVRFDDSSGEWVPYAEIKHTNDLIPEDSGNSSRFNVNLKSLRIYRLPDKDYPDKNNLVLTWKPINPAFNGNLSPGLEPVPFWPGLHAKISVAWQHDDLGTLPYSGIKHYNMSEFWVDMPAHLNHYFLPWNYVEHIKQNSSIGGFKIQFQVRTNDGSRLRQVSDTDRIFRIRGHRLWRW